MKECSDVYRLGFFIFGHRAGGGVVLFFRSSKFLPSLV